MKFLKQITSAIMSITIVAGTAAAGYFSEMTAEAADNAVQYSSITNNWDQVIKSERAKFPDRHYWNHNGVSEDQWGEDCSSTNPCFHTQEDILGTSDDSETYIKKSVKPGWEEDEEQVKKADHDGQCNGFARKLARDIWKTDDFVRYDNQNRDYEPKIGDVVRLSFEVEGEIPFGSSKWAEHSIFITKVTDYYVEFAECNGDMQQCQIFWDSFYYYSKFTYQDVTVKDANNNDVTVPVRTGEHKVLVTKDYIKKYTTYYERPILRGDFDLNGRIDNKDVEHFRNTYLSKGEICCLSTGGSKRYGSYDEVFDVNSDGRISDSDYSYLQYYAGLTYVDGYIYGAGPKDPVHDRQYVKDEYFIYNGGIYKTLNSTEATFVGQFYTNDIIFDVDSVVYDQNNRKYTVTAIGNENDRPGGGGYIKTLRSITIPETVTTIKRYAFSSNDTALAYISVRGNNPKLQTIEEGAFYYCSQLQTVDLRNCKNLKQIGNNAFYNCKSLRYVYLPYRSNYYINRCSLDYGRYLFV